MNRPEAAPPPLPEDETPGVPIFRTWRGVYWFVAACFAAVVAALTVFSHWFA
jgi:hypothetical protein